MAIVARDIPITREDVAGWLAEYPGQLRPTKKLREFLQAKVDALSLPDDEVNTVEHDSLGDSTSVVDMILMDLRSYARS